MVGRVVRRLLKPLRLLAEQLVPPPSPYVGDYGCLHTAASFVAWNQIEGDYLEFGVYRGDSFAAAYHALMRHRDSVSPSDVDSQEFKKWKAALPRLFAFDSFEGLPSGPGARQLDYCPGAYGCSEAEFKSNIAKARVDLDRVVTVAGFYDRTLGPETKKQHRLTKAAVVMIDCDLYESTVPVLDFITDLVGQGTVIIFHDWFRFKGSPDYGEQKACREWLARNPHLELIEHWRQGPQAVSFLVNLK
jgi:O-methyltransferase